MWKGKQERKSENEMATERGGTRGHERGREQDWQLQRMREKCSYKRDGREGDRM